MNTEDKMAQAPVAEHDDEHEDTSTGLNHRKMLMWAFLSSDCMFFATLIATYLVYRGKSKIGPFPEDLFSIPVTSVSTFVLLMSSMSMVLAYAALRRGSIKTYRVWLLSTIIMGATFLGFQTFEFFEFVNHEVHIDCHKYHATPGEFSEFEAGIADRECTEGVEEYEGTHGLTPRTNLFGTTFYTLTGLHGTHVTIGVIWLLALFFYSFKKGGVTPKRHLDTDLAALYWHFVDVVWIIIFPVVYLFGVFEGYPT